MTRIIEPFIEGRVYTSSDLHGAALVWMDRRRAIEKMLIKDFPEMKLHELVSVLRTIELYATCSEELFTDVVGR
jgi:hypothetical protein